MEIYKCTKGLYEDMWYVLVQGWYLHKDGIVRKNALPSAFFPTEGEAERALNKYKAAAAVNSDPLSHDAVSDIFVGQMIHVFEYWADVLKKEYERGYEEGKLSQSQQAGWRVEKMTNKEVAKSLKDAGALGTWYIFNGHRYLHADGSIRPSVICNNVPSGYFESEQAAREVLLLFECRQLMKGMDGDARVRFVHDIIHTLYSFKE